MSSWTALDHSLPLVSRRSVWTSMPSKTKLFPSFAREEFDDAVKEKYLFREERRIFSENLVKEWTGLVYWGSEDCYRACALDGTDDEGGGWWEEMIGKLSNEERGRRWD